LKSSFPEDFFLLGEYHKNMVLENLCIITFVGASIQAMTGFGAPILMLAFFPKWFPYTTSVTLCHLIAIASTGYLMMRYRKHIQWKTLFPVLALSLVFCAGAAIFSISLSSSFMTRLLGIFLVILSICFLCLPQEIHIKATPRNGIITGILAGICNGFFGISAPPTAIYLMSAINSKEAYLSTIQTFFFFSNIESILIRTFAGSMSAEGVWKYVPIGWIAILAGTFAGQQAFKRLSIPILRKTVYVFVGLAGFWNIFSVR